MKVYLLYSGCYSQRGCIGVYSSLEKAQAQRTDGVTGWEPWPEENPTRWDSIHDTNSWGDGYDIEEHELELDVINTGTAEPLFSQKVDVDPRELRQCGRVGVDRTGMNDRCVLPAGHDSFCVGLGSD